MAATAAEDIVNGRRPQADGNSDGGAIDLGLDALVTGRFFSEWTRGAVGKVAIQIVYGKRAR
jgi:hypothetical protein